MIKLELPYSLPEAVTVYLIIICVGLYGAVTPYLKPSLAFGVLLSLLSFCTVVTLPFPHGSCMYQFLCQHSLLLQDTWDNGLIRKTGWLWLWASQYITTWSCCLGPVCHKELTTVTSGEGLYSRRFPGLELNRSPACLLPIPYVSDMFVIMLSRK